MEDSFFSYVEDQFSGIGKISIRKMFGGAGIYCQGVMFGLISDNIIYLKTDDSNKSDFEKLDLKPFKYNAKGKEISMSYYEIPEDILENSEILEKWASKSLKIALKNLK